MITKRNLFAKNLIKYRKIKNLSQEELAEITGLSRRTIAHYETKAIDPPINKIQKIANALNIDISLLLEKNTDKKTDIFDDIDIKTLKKILLIKKLSPKNRNTIYDMIDLLLERESKRKDKAG